MNKQIGLFSAIGIIMVTVCLRLFPYRDIYTQLFDLRATSQLYNHSQYAINPSDRFFIIEDWQLYPYVGWKYLTSGGLSYINIEHPPLGKYLFGLAVLTTKSSSWVQIPLAIFSLIFLFLIGYKTFWNLWLALIPPLLFILDPLFITNTTRSLLDQLLVTLIVVFAWLADTSLKSIKLKNLGLGLLLGGIAGTKFIAPALIVWIAYLLYYFLILRNRKVFPLLVILTTAFILYLLLYSPLILSTGFTGFIEIHYQAAKIHAAHVPNYPLFAALRVMILNEWPVWWDSIDPIWQVKEWTPTWPLLVFSLILSPLMGWYVRKNLASFAFPLIFSWLYFIFINTRLFFPNYLYLLLPFLYLLLIMEGYFIYKLWFQRSNDR